MCVATEEGKKQTARRRAEVTGKVWCAMEGRRCTVAFLGYRLGAHIGFANFIVAAESDRDSFVGRSPSGGESLLVSEHKSAGS